MLISIYSKKNLFYVQKQTKVTLVFKMVFRKNLSFIYKHLIYRLHYRYNCSSCRLNFHVLDLELGSSAALARMTIGGLSLPRIWRSSTFARPPRKGLPTSTPQKITPRGGVRVSLVMH